MNEEQVIKEIEKKGFFVEEQPRFKITSESDEGFLMEVDDLFDFFKSLDFGESGSTKEAIKNMNELD